MTGRFIRPGRFVTPDQAMQISQAVKMVAMELGKRSKKNEYGSAYGQLYRYFGVTSNKQWPASQFDQAMAWLNSWYKRITGATEPDLDNPPKTIYYTVRYGTSKYDTVSVYRRGFLWERQNFTDVRPSYSCWRNTGTRPRLRW